MGATWKAGEQLAGGALPLGYCICGVTQTLGLLIIPPPQHYPRDTRMVDIGRMTSPTWTSHPDNESEVALLGGEPPGRQPDARPGSAADCCRLGAKSSGLFFFLDQLPCD